MEGTRSGRPLLAASVRPRAGVLLAGRAILVAVLGVAGAAVGVGTVCGLALALDLIPAVRPSRIPRRSAAT
jgi:hypothetical protein